MNLPDQTDTLLFARKFLRPFPAIGAAGRDKNSWYGLIAGDVRQSAGCPDRLTNFNNIVRRFSGVFERS
jgi:hypothetical protein